MFILIYNAKLCHFNFQNFKINTLYFGEGNGNPLQYSCMENSMNGGAW